MSVADAARMSDACSLCGIVEQGPFCPVHGVVHRAFSISGRYEVGALLAASAAAFVFGADDQTTRRAVAIKVLRSERADSPWELATPLPETPSKRESQREFQRAAATLAGLPLEHASEILNVGRDDVLGVTYVVIDREGEAAAMLDARGWSAEPARPAARRPSEPDLLTRLERMTLPETIGSYRVVRELGTGGTGRVYLGEHPVIHSQVAIKVLFPDIARQRDTVERFMQEARASSQIGSPHIPRYFDFGTTPNGQPYAVMEYFEGETLGRRLLRTGTLSIEETAHIVDQVASAMQMAHDAGLIHRDLKPENLLLVDPPAPPGRLRSSTPTTASMTAQPAARLADVKLLDFGIAKVVGRRSAAQTQDGAFLGTPFYCAPEQVFGNEVDARTDVYSLGATAFEMLTGAPPFTGEVPDILSAKATAEPPDPRRFGVPDVVASTIHAMLARDPARRAPSMAWVRAEVARWTRPGGMESRPPDDDEAVARAVRNPDASVRLGRADTAMPEPPADELEASAPRRGMGWMVVGGLAVAVALTVVAIAGLGRSPTAATRAPTKLAPPPPVASAPSAPSVTSPPPSPPLPVVQAASAPPPTVAAPPPPAAAPPHRAPVRPIHAAPVGKPAVRPPVDDARPGDTKEVIIVDPFSQGK
jgi:serine/threonine protein kinase